MSNISLRACLISLCAGVAIASASTVFAAGKIPVILDTDIGDDIDDTWALVMLLKSPELDLKLVVTDFGNTVYRAKIVARLLEVAGRPDIPIGVGRKSNDREGNQASWVKDYDLKKYPGKVYDDGVQALIDTILNSKEKPTLICIGPPDNIQTALGRSPEIARRARFVGMFGSIRRGYDGKKDPEVEWNVKGNIEGTRQALSAPWDITITPLDTCGIVKLTGKKYAAVRDSADPLLRGLIENYRAWCGKTPERAEAASSTLFDTVAVYLAFSQELLSMETLGIRVGADGMTLVDPAAKKMRCAMNWKDLPAFEDLLVRRLTGK